MSRKKKGEAALLDDARNLILDHGWIRGHMGDPESGFCAVGALDYARKQGRFRRRTMRRAGQLLSAIVGRCSMVGIMDWNDSTYGFVVIEGFRQAIEAGGGTPTREVKRDRRKHRRYVEYNSWYATNTSTANNKSGALEKPIDRPLFAELIPPARVMDADSPILITPIPSEVIDEAERILQDKVSV